MVCYFPCPVFFTVRDDGKKDLHFKSVNTNFAIQCFREGVPFPKHLVDRILMLPCSRCIGCRLERSRQWAVRITHEASLYEQNSFLTLTFNNESLASQCPDGSLDRRHMQLFIKRLRQVLPQKVRVFYCGEYGEKFSRPHYHMCLFNCDFSDDRVLWSIKKGFKYYTSRLLSDVWGFGHAVISDLTFDSAAYVARYCTKKITGKMASDHYKGRLPEFCQASLKPGIGTGWLEKFGQSDVFCWDELVINGARCKPPRFYDKYLEKIDPIAFSVMKKKRIAGALLRASDSTDERLLVRERCQQVRFKRLIRSIEILKEVV